jgi:hypothetical protein
MLTFAASTEHPRRAAALSDLRRGRLRARPRCVQEGHVPHPDAAADHHGAAVDARRQGQLLYAAAGAGRRKRAAAHAPGARRPAVRRLHADHDVLDVPAHAAHHAAVAEQNAPKPPRLALPGRCRHDGAGADGRHAGPKPLRARRRRKPLAAHASAAGAARHTSLRVPRPRRCAGRRKRVCHRRRLPRDAPQARGRSFLLVFARFCVQFKNSLGGGAATRGGAFRTPCPPPPSAFGASAEQGFKGRHGP